MFTFPFVFRKSGQPNLFADGHGYVYLYAFMHYITQTGKDTNITYFTK